MTSNPYQSPTSDLGDQEVLRYSIIWKMYFFFITLLSIFGFTVLYFDPNFGLVEILSIILFIPATIGLFGYIFRKKILNPKLWNLFFLGYIAWSILYIFVSEIDQQAGMSEMEYIISMTIGWVLSIPGYLALFYYGRITCSIWSENA